MLVFALLLSAVVNSQYLGLNEFFADVDDAQARCNEEGLNLCTNGQVYAIAFASVGQDYRQEGICLSAFYADGTVGWWNAQEGFCSGVGQFHYARAEPGAHCCGANVPDLVPATCGGSGNPCDGTNILDAENLSSYCLDGVCDDAQCCKAYTPAAEYLNHGGYAYSSADEALAACQTLHEDYQLCTKTQIISIFEHSDYYTDVCSSGWYYDDELVEHRRGWYVREDQLDTCPGSAGWRAWQRGDGLGSAHCCVPSYHASGYIDRSVTTTQQSARDYCESRNDYSYTLCTKKQLQTVAFTEPDTIVCMSGRLETGDVGDDVCGWENVDESCSSVIGFRAWCPNYAGAHCCQTYVQEYDPLGDYTIPATGYDVYPQFYAESSFVSGVDADDFCVSAGYPGVCTVEQVKYIAENQAAYGNPGCKTAWALDEGVYSAGHWGTACGKNAEWYDTWQPVNPLAHCCTDAVPSSARIQHPLVRVPAKGQGYPHSSFDQAVGTCGDGYSLCTRNQVEYVATVGALREDGSVQLEENLCYQGYMADGSKGWYQAQEAVCGATGWREFNGNGGAYCCLPFDAPLGTAAPTAAPAIPVYKYLGIYVYPYSSADQALEACQAEDSRYELCNDDEVVEVTVNGAVVDGVDGVEGVEPLGRSFPGFCDPARSEPEYSHGQYLASGVWDTWMSGGTNAGAHCCLVGLIDAAPHPEVTETLAPSRDPTSDPTPSPTSSPTSETTLPEATTGSPTSDPTEFVPYSDLPSTVAEPEDCVERADLVPAGFEGVIQYCATADLIYLNGQTTCVDPSDVDADTLVREAFENDWYLASNTCAGQKSYDLATDDQLFITNHMLNELEDDIDQLEEDLTTNSEDLDAYLEQWKADVAALINDNLSNFDETTQEALRAYIENNLTTED